MKSKRFLFRKSNGRFRQGTLRDLGVKDSELSDGGLKMCEACGKETRPIMKRWVCVCGHQQERV